MNRFTNRDARFAKGEIHHETTNVAYADCMGDDGVVYFRRRVPRVGRDFLFLCGIFSRVRAASGWGKRMSG